MSDETAGFWFFGPLNTEMLFKVLDGCVVNDRQVFSIHHAEHAAADFGARQLDA